MTIVVLGSGGGWTAHWPQETRKNATPETVVDLSAPLAGPVTGFLQFAVARLACELKKDDLVLWDLAETIRARVRAEETELDDALRVTEMFLRALDRGRAPLAALLSEGREDAVRAESDPVRAGFTHLFERYGVPTLSLSQALRRQLRVKTLGADQFDEDGLRYSADPETQAALAEAVAAFVGGIAPRRQIPMKPPKALYPKASGAIRVALPAHASGGEGVGLVRVTLGEAQADAYEIAPGGFVDFPVQGELIGVVAMLGPDQGALALSSEPAQLKTAEGAPIGLTASTASVGDVTQGLSPALPLLKAKTALRIANVSAACGPDAELRHAAHAAGAPPADGLVRVLGLVERRANTTLKSAIADAATD